MVMAMSITADSLPLRPKFDCDVGYGAAVKGARIVVYVLCFHFLLCMLYIVA